MTSELRPAVEVWQGAYGVWGDPSLPDTNKADQAAAAVIEADREAVRAGQAAELAKFKALAETLAGASEALQEDMLLRARMKQARNGGDLVVEAGNGAWFRFNEALRQYKEATQ